MKLTGMLLQVFLLSCCFSSQTVYAEPPAPDSRIILAADGYPTGHTSPEGVTADFFRAYATHDSELLASVCLRPNAGGETRREYEAFLAHKTSLVRSEAARVAPSAGWPQSLGGLFAARHLSSNGPASYGYASFGFQDVMFVDAQIRVSDGSEVVGRMLVVRDENGRWYVHPAPQISPLLSMGLTEESPSTMRFDDANDVQTP